MIIAGPCLYINDQFTDEVLQTADELQGFATHFRCKIWGGGSSVEKYFAGVGSTGAATLQTISDFMPVGTEVQDRRHLNICKDLDYVWVGGRNCQNYRLLQDVARHRGDVFVKRGPGVTIDEMAGIYDIMLGMHNKEIYIIERGINTFDRLADSRWSPDLKGAIRLKMERPDIFKRYVVDISHSTGRKELIPDTYKAFEAIGVKHFMAECTASGFSHTDARQNMTVAELKDIFK